jgi:hypothetical protein
MESRSWSSAVGVSGGWAKGLEGRLEYGEARERDVKAEDNLVLEEGSAEDEGAEPS